MSPLLLALLLSAEPNVKAATACMEVAQTQHAACMEVVRGDVPVDGRTAAARRCGAAYEQALEQCLTANGVPVSDEQRSRWRARAAISEALSACFGGVENDFAWCASRVATDADLQRCRAAADRGFTACKVERDRQEVRLREGAADPAAAAGGPAP